MILYLKYIFFRITELQKKHEKARATDEGYQPEEIGR